MLPAANQPTPAPAWGATLQPGDVVLFRFPCAEAEDIEPKRRTCLVLEVDDRDGRRFVELAYGTTANTTANTGDEIHLVTPDDLARAGVHRPTRFVCARRVTVTLDHPAWDINPAHPSPIIGSLPPVAARRMNAIRSATGARRARNAACRAARRRPFTVEYRRKRRPSLPAKAVRR